MDGRFDAGEARADDDHPQVAPQAQDLAEVTAEVGHVVPDARDVDDDPVRLFLGQPAVVGEWFHKQINSTG